MEHDELEGVAEFFKGKKGRYVSFLIKLDSSKAKKDVMLAFLLSGIGL